MPDSFPHGPRQPFQESNWNTPSTKGGYQKVSNQFGYQKASNQFGYLPQNSTLTVHGSLEIRTKKHTPAIFLYLCTQCSRFNF